MRRKHKLPKPEITINGQPYWFADSGVTGVHITTRPTGMVRVGLTGYGIQDHIMPNAARNVGLAFIAAAEHLERNI